VSVRPVREGLFQTDPPGLLGTRCDECGGHTFPRAATCPYCGSERVADALLSPTGSLWLWTTVTAAPPGYTGDVPYGFGIVELPEGVRVITRLAVPDDSFVEGLPVHLRFVALPTGDAADAGDAVETWEFAP
jgi:uncharacterized OB-fold protein